MFAYSRELSSFDAAIVKLERRDDLAVTLVTQVRNRKALESDPIADDVHLHVIDNEFVQRPFFRVGDWLRGGSQLSWTMAVAARGIEVKENQRKPFHAAQHDPTMPELSEM